MPRITQRVMRVMTALLAITVALAAPAEAHQVRPTLITVGVLIDGTGAPPRRDIAIVLRDDRIAEIRPATAEDATAPGVLDLGEFYVLPGLIDVHAHLTLSHDPALDYGDISGPASAILGVVHAKRTLMAGFTTVRDPGGPHYADVALRDAITAGWVDGPRTFVSGPILTMTGGHGAVGNWAPPDLHLESSAASVVDGVDEIRRAVRLHQKYGVDFIKIIASGGIFTDHSEPGAAAYTREEITAAVEEARKRGQHVAAHAHGLDAIRNAIDAGVRSIEHGSYLDEETAKLMAKQGVFLVPDVYADEYSLLHGDSLGLDADHLAKAREVSAHFRESFRLARSAGAKIAFGSDAGVYPHGENARQFALYVSLGMSPMEALRSATVVAAELIGSADVGTLEVGKYADLIAVPADPLRDIRQLESVPFVMKGGVVVKDEIRQTGVPARSAGAARPAPARDFAAVAPMDDARAAHTATALLDGRVLIAGGMTEGSGDEGALSTTELFGPEPTGGAGRFRPAAPMLGARMSHTATRLADGRALLVGGYGPGNAYLATAELYDPRTNQFTPAGPMGVARAGHTATLLSDGRVLVLGGVGAGWTFLASAEVYDPATNAFRPTGGMTVARESHTATRLPDGTILVVGGHSGRRADLVLYASSERYDPRAEGGRGAFSPSATMTVRRHKHDAVALADGRVLVTGGADERDDRGAYRSAEIFDPRANGGDGRFVRTGDLELAHYKHAGTSILLGDGSVLIAGGAASPERYDPGTGRFTVVAPAPRTPPLRGSFSAVAELPDGRVLVTGGYGGGHGATAQAWAIDTLREEAEAPRKSSAHSTAAGK